MAFFAGCGFRKTPEWNLFTRILDGSTVYPSVENYLIVTGCLRPPKRKEFKVFKVFYARVPKNCRCRMFMAVKISPKPQNPDKSFSAFDFIK